MSDRIENEEGFQEEIQKLQTALTSKGSSIMKLYEFVKDEDSYRASRIELVDRSINEALRQLGMLDTYNGGQNELQG